MLRPLALVALWPTIALGDELQATRAQDVVEVSHSVDIRVAGGVATYKVQRHFANRGKVADEVQLAIDLPTGAAATGLRIRARERWYSGDLLEREQAARLYHQLTGMGPFAPKDPALLQWEWADKLHLQIFPVLPKSVSTVEYTLTAPTRYANGRYWISYPRGSAGLATPTLRVTPAWNDAQIVVDGHQVAANATARLDPPPRGDAPGAVASTLVVPASSHTQKPIASAKLDLAITHTYKSDLRVELVTPQGKRVVVHDHAGGDANDIRGVQTVALPAGTTGAGTWRLVAIDEAALDTGSIDRFALSFGSGADATSAQSVDTPVFIPDAPEGDGDESGVATIAITSPSIERWLARFGRVVASPAHAFARLEIDVAPQLSQLPKRAQVVFVLDASYSVGSDGLAAQLATMRAYVSHVPDADVEVVVYRRFATRLFNTFVPARELDVRLARASLSLGNGSALDEGAAVAAQAIASRTAGPRRIVLLTDELVRTSLSRSLALASLAKLPSDVIVHVVVPDVDHDDRATLTRDDGHPLAGLATSHHGILARLRGFPLHNAKDLALLALELVRPTRIEKLTAAGITLETSTLREGEGLRAWVKHKHVPAKITLDGLLWSDPVRTALVADKPFSRATAAFVFGADEHQGLSEREMMTVARAGRAVSPVTSYVAVEPGTRPSSIGFDDTNVYGGLLGNEPGEMNGGFGFGGTRQPPDLRALIDTRTCAARYKPAPGWRLTLDIETTRDEIVDVTARSQRSPFTKCLVEAAWAVRLGAQFDREREKFFVELR